MKPTSKPKTTFGVDVAAFTARYGIRIKDLTDEAGVSFTYYNDVATGVRSAPWYEEKVRAVMQAYENKQKAAENAG